MDHGHGPEASISEEADPLYRPLDGLHETAPVDESGWSGAVDHLREVQAEDPDWAAMVDQGMLLTAAYRSAALDGLYPAATALSVALLLGEARLGDLDEQVRVHVRANVDALQPAAEVHVSEASIRRIHEVACRPQLHHRVRVGDHVQDHVLAAGDYKHHPNHVHLPDGTWQPTAPVALVASEMAVLVGQAARPSRPVVRAAYLHDALLHVQPFADGNGRVARALAGGLMLRAASPPFLPFDTAIALIDLLVSADHEGPALDRWRTEDEAGEAIRRRLVTGVAAALDRYAGRPSRRADLSGATVGAGDAVVISVAPTVDEVITVDAHRDGPVLVTAVGAGLGLGAAPGADIDAWLDRVVSTLALRVAAELD